MVNRSPLVQQPQGGHRYVVARAAGVQVCLGSKGGKGIVQ
jgi:hypothetical protein